MKSTQLLAQTDTSSTVNNSESQKGHGKNKTDQVYEALSLLISDSNINLMQENDFVNALRVIVKQTEDSQQRQKNNMASLCTLVTFTVFFLMMFMIGLFAYRLHSITNNLMEHLSDSQMEFKVNASIARNSTKFWKKIFNMYLFFRIKKNERLKFNIKCFSNVILFIYYIKNKNQLSIFCTYFNVI